MSMTTEIIARVDAWISARRRTGMTETMQALAHEWSRRPFRLATARTEQAREAIDAAMTGVLLALVREAWGCDEFRRLTIESAGEGWCVVVRNGRHRPPSRARAGWDLDKDAHPLRGIKPPFGDNEFATEAEALTAALEAAL